MSLTFRKAPKVFKIIAEDEDGSRRVATATERVSNNSRTAQWDLELTHPSGNRWPATFAGPNILDALSQLVHEKENDYKLERSRGHRPERQLRDPNQRIDESGDNLAAPIKQWR